MYIKFKINSTRTQTVKNQIQREPIGINIKQSKLVQIKSLLETETELEKTAETLQAIIINPYESRCPVNKRRV